MKQQFYSEKATLPFSTGNLKKYSKMRVLTLAQSIKCWNHLQAICECLQSPCGNLCGTLWGSTSASSVGEQCPGIDDLISPISHLKFLFCWALYNLDMLVVKKFHLDENVGTSRCKLFSRLCSTSKYEPEEKWICARAWNKLLSMTFLVLLAHLYS